MTTFEIASESTAIFAADASTGSTGGVAIPVEGCLELSFVCTWTGTGDIVLLECDEEAGEYTPVTAEDIYGSLELPTPVGVTDGASIIGYKGWKNYVKVGTGSAPTTLSVVALKSGCRHCPTQ